MMVRIGCVPRSNVWSNCSASLKKIFLPLLALVEIAVAHEVTLEPTATIRIPRPYGTITVLISLSVERFISFSNTRLSS